MSKAPILVLDVSTLAYRALYRVGQLSHNGDPTGAIYGVFQTLLSLMDMHMSDRVAFCFDRGYTKRSELWRSYKHGRHKDQTPEEKEAHLNLKKQLYRLREESLPGIGFKNVFAQDGYEADDVIASVCLNMDSGDEAVIVSGDHDLYQLLSPRVNMWLPKGEMVTMEKFVKQYGISPSQWADVKAIAGCPGDNVIGVKGVGDKTAAKFLSGLLKPKTKAYEAIVAGNDIWRRNLPLVSLPFEGTEVFKVQEDSFNQGKWNQVMESMGMRTLRNRGPGRQRTQL